MKVGVLALQGDFQEHRTLLGQIGVESCEVRLPGELEDIAALIIPGGESTTIGKLAQEYGCSTRCASSASRIQSGGHAPAPSSSPATPSGNNHCSG